MTQTITKRSGAITEFDSTRILDTIQKAFQETKTICATKDLKSIADSVNEAVNFKFFDQKKTPHVEQIKDEVEKAISKAGFFEVAKVYILYRYKKQEEKAGSLIHVKKRNGDRVLFDIAAVYDELKIIRRSLAIETLDIDGILKEVKLGIFDDITTRDIQKLLIFTLRGRIERDPVYSRAAALALHNELYKSMLLADPSNPGFESLYQAQFQQSIQEGVTTKRYDSALNDFDLKKLANELVVSRDLLLDYLGAETLHDRYYMRSSSQKILELPQMFWMRVAMGLAINEKNREEKAIEFYHLMSQLQYIPSTPTLFHAGTLHPQMSSCYINYVSDDLNSIFKIYQDHAQLSKWSGGIGTSWSAVRGTGAMIKSTNVNSQGVIPFLKIADSTTAAINRSGKRRGAAVVYLETWHFDIEHFLDLRKNTGDDRRRTHDLNTANWIPDLFMKRVQKGLEWTLFSPDETPELNDLYGREFEKKYEEYEKKCKTGEIVLYKKVEAQTLWKKMISMLFETGHPWVTFKDPSNIRSPQDHVGVVHSSNLCTEITLNTSDQETAVCNLGSINLFKHIYAGGVDWQQLAKTISTAIRMLDNVIDLNYYPTKEAKKSNLAHRPIGLGIMGMQDALFALNINFDTQEAVDWNDRLMEFISYEAISSSSTLAVERGQYSSFQGSKWSRGIFPLDTLNLLEKERGYTIIVDRDFRLDWESLKKRVQQNGMRNSNTMAIAPTATISLIANVYPSIEAPYKNLYTKSNQAGEFTVVNEALVKDLKKLGLWSPAMLSLLKQQDGTIQHITSLPQELKTKYKEAFDLDPMWTIKHAAARGKWIDQSQSINIFTATTSGKALSDTYTAAWNYGLKTTYYLRTLGATSIEKSTVELAMATQPQIVATTPEIQACLINDPDCEACQ